MQLCSSGHEEVCFDEGYGGRNACPACAMIEERDEKQIKIEELEEKIESLETQPEEAEAGA